MRYAFLFGCLLLIGCGGVPDREVHERMNLNRSPPPHDTRPLSLSPEWSRFAVEHVQQVVLGNLSSPSTATVYPPINVGARYDATSNLSWLSALGECDAQNRFGAVIRATYTVEWKQEGNAAVQQGQWEPYSCNVFGS